MVITIEHSFVLFLLDFPLVFEQVKAPLFGTICPIRPSPYVVLSPLFSFATASYTSLEILFNSGYTSRLLTSYLSDSSCFPTFTGVVLLSQALPISHWYSTGLEISGPELFWKNKTFWQSESASPSILLFSQWLLSELLGHN